MSDAKTQAEILAENGPPPRQLLQWFRRLAPDLRFGQVPNATDAPHDNAEYAAAAETLSQAVPLLSVSRPAMACEFEVLLNRDQDPQAVERAVAALELVESLEGLLSVYKTRSDFSAINRFGAERAVLLQPDSAEVLQLALDLYRLTGSAFDITAGRLSEVWGFSRRLGKMPSQDAIAEALRGCGSQHLRLAAAGTWATLASPGVQVNPGGIGKGFALDRAAQELRQHGIADFMIHGGLSSIVARGSRQQGSKPDGWQVALKHPWRSAETLGVVRLRDEALGTSGSGKQFFHFGGRRFSHIIDPRSGWPAEGMLSATVICPSGAVADALATALFVLGPVEARRFCERQPQVAAILVYVEPKSGRTTIETLNLAAGSWTSYVDDSWLEKLPRTGGASSD